MALSFKDIDPINPWKEHEWRHRMTRLVSQVETSVDRKLREGVYTLLCNTGREVQIEVDLFAGKGEESVFERTADQAKDIIAAAVEGRYFAAGWDDCRILWDKGVIHLRKEHPPLV